MKKIISILTASRAEYGLLRPLIKKLVKVKEFDIRIVVTGMHLSGEYGYTYKEIEEDKFLIDKKIEILLTSDSNASISKSMGLAMISFSDYFEELKPDLLLVLGDRYETLAVCIAAMNARIPIAHLYGGETTEGAIDESIRHAITKMSYIHFTSTAEYRKRVVQLGEEPERVYEVGAIGIENIMNEPLLSKQELEKSLHFDLTRPYAIITFHPVTLESEKSEKQFLELLNAIEEHKELNYIMTKANADAGGKIINQLIDNYERENNNVISFHSLGMIRYLSALKFAKMVIGNSSSGLLEAPTFKIPTINIGDRQRGRIVCDSIINCKPIAKDIDYAINRAQSLEFKKIVDNVRNPYGDGNTSDKIVNVLQETLLTKNINLKKSFYNINVNI